MDFNPEGSNEFYVYLAHGGDTCGFCDDFNGRDNPFTGSHFGDGGSKAYAIHGEQTGYGDQDSGSEGEGGTQDSCIFIDGVNGRCNFYNLESTSCNDC